MLPGIGLKTQIKLAKLNLFRPLDLLYHFPHRYLDFSRQVLIAHLLPHTKVTIQAKITNYQNIITKTGKNLQIVSVKDVSGGLDLIWFNQPYLSSIFKVGQTFCFAGTVVSYRQRLTFFAPEYGQFSTKGLIAVYPETAGLTSRWFRKTIQSNFKSLLSLAADTLPPSILKHYCLPSLGLALRAIHQPHNLTDLYFAKLRLSLDEVLSLLATTHSLKLLWLQKKPAKALKGYPVNLNKLIRSLPFTLSASQYRSWQEVQADLLSTTTVCHRLLIGDVGSGKTIIAILASLLTSLNHQRSLILVPTQILSQQHYQTFKKFLPDLPIYLLNATSKITLSSLPIDAVIIATHAAIKQSQFFRTVSLLVIDEQHKFGVAQRSFLSDLPHPPHSLIMSATPIPRTVGLTLLGHFQLSRLDPLPHYQAPKTFLVPENKIIECYRWLNQQITTRQIQAFIVCPFISPSETLDSVKSATAEFHHLASTIFPKLKIALVHGKTKPAARNRLIGQFINRQVDILVTTPIIEVGIDIPNANVIIIQSADRFGLAQLHQLRGRIGRGHDQGYCFLLTPSPNPAPQDRLRFFCQNLDGAKIAQYDLKNRGPGEVLTTLQHGKLRSRLVDFNNLKLIALGQKIFSDLLQIPHFNPQSLIKSLPVDSSLNISN